MEGLKSSLRRFVAPVALAAALLGNRCDNGGNVDADVGEEDANAAHVVPAITEFVGIECRLTCDNCCEHGEAPVEVQSVSPEYTEPMSPDDIRKYLGADGPGLGEVV